MSMLLKLLQPLLATLLDSLPSSPAEQSVLDNAVKNAIEESKKHPVAESTRKSQWEFLLKNEVFNLAVTEGKALKDNEDVYYATLKRLLDVVLAFTEHEECEQTFPFVVLQDLLETQTIASCSHIFAWIEARAARLTVDLKPQKGKALILLRSLNDLLRRLSKTGATTVFCGRILTFLSGVFPLGERSGVNLRGEYGPVWEGVGEPGRKRARTSFGEDGADGDTMQVDAQEEKKTAQTPSEKKEEFYDTFWGLQLPFSKPPLFAKPETFPQFKESVNKVLPVIKEATAKERAMMGSRANASTAIALKRKREPENDEINSTNQEYFFAKFLTSPDLIDLEIADTHFRRQFLFQLLILLHHLMTFTKTAKAAWMAPNNRALQMDFTLESADTQWVQETITRAMEELRQTTPNGRAFSDAVNVILEREKNWVGWKNHLCAPFDKAPITFPIGVDKVGTLFEATSEKRAKMREPPEEYPWSHGSEALTEIWEMGCRGLTDLEQPFQPGDVKDFLKKVKMEDQRIELRKKALIQKKLAEQKRAPPPPKKEETPPVKSEAPMKTEELPPSKPSTPAPSDTLAPPQSMNVTGSPLHPSLPAKPGSAPLKLPPSQDVEMSEASAIHVPTQAPAAEVLLAEPKPVEIPPDPLISKYEESKQRWAWLALRTARDQHLQHFGKIGTGDIELLAKEIELEKERQERERAQKEKGEETKGEDVKSEEGKEEAGGVSVSNGVAESGGENPMAEVSPVQEKTQGEDMKMSDASVAGS
ncbi:hypothetical protein H2248_001446 [Termitomyces sp. 'cryptogamus']|nr:hypothetical protein H2248_001446 [Termitomyces sp. 'cryptogamus']